MLLIQNRYSGCSSPRGAGLTGELQASINWCGMFGRMMATASTPVTIKRSLNRSVPLSPVRVRQHVNPLSQKYQHPVSLPEWEKIYANPIQPLLLDIGSARGRFLQQLALLQLHWNFLGLEIRQPLVEEANVCRDEAGLTNLHYLFSNANTDLSGLLASLPSGVLQRITIQFPDPWFKKRHQKRRVVQPELVGVLAAHLVCGGEVFLQSDVEEVAQQMCDRFAECPQFARSSPHWLAENPFPIATEREIGTFEKGEPVYRALFRRQPRSDQG